MAAIGYTPNPSRNGMRPVPPTRTIGRSWLAIVAGSIDGKLGVAFEGHTKVVKPNSAAGRREAVA
jgi:hypothetical protein